MPNNECPSLHKVVCCNDLVTEIMVRLPVRTLIRFKCVSKDWYSLITNPSFKRLHPDPPSGLFVKARHPYQYEFVPFKIRKPFEVEVQVEPALLKPGVRIHHSCNGLMLCSLHLSSESTLTYYVYNPTINQFAMIPKPELVGTEFDMTLAFDPLKSPHYRVVYVHHHLGPEFGHNCQIDIYSSKTRTFKPSYKLSLDNLDKFEFDSGVYWNNALHWVNGCGFVSYFNLDQEAADAGIKKIQTPFGLLWLRYNIDYASYIFESRDHLLLVEINRHNIFSKFDIHELKRDYLGWCVKYHIDPWLGKHGGSFPAWCVSRNKIVVLSLVLGEKEDDDSFLVLELPDKLVVRYNLVSNTFHKLHRFACRRPLNHKRSIRQVEWPNVYQFSESLYIP